MLNAPNLCSDCHTPLTKENWTAGNARRNRRICASCAYRRTKSYTVRNRAWAHGKNREYRKRVRLEVLTHYGAGRLACVSCHFSDPRALTIDHVENDGAQHRKTLSKNGKNESSGNSVYAWLKKHKFPPGFQTLCMNCNFIKARAYQDKLHVEKLKNLPLKRKWTRNNPEGLPKNLGKGIYRYNGRFCGRFQQHKKQHWVNLAATALKEAAEELKKLKDGEIKRWSTAQAVILLRKQFAAGMPPTTSRQPLASRLRCRI